MEPRAGLGVNSGSSSTRCCANKSCGCAALASMPVLSLFSGLITTFGARMFSILHDADGVFGILSALAIALLADTGPFALVGPVPVWAFFGHDCIGYG